VVESPNKNVCSAGEGDSRPVQTDISLRRVFDRLIADPVSCHKGPFVNPQPLFSYVLRVSGRFLERRLHGPPPGTDHPGQKAENA
jgi:hypothetical protein